MRVPVTDLVGTPGASRDVRETVVRADLDAADGAPDTDGIAAWGPAAEVVQDPIEVALTLDAITEGILARGTIDVDLVVPCSRCLEPQALEQTVPVTELFVDPRRLDEDEDVDDDAYLIDPDLHIDLSVLLRDVIVMEVPVQVLCREDCQGLCPECGTNRNDTDCGHRPDSGTDPRWADLADLELPPG